MENKLVESIIAETLGDRLQETIGESDAKKAKAAGFRIAKPADASNFPEDFSPGSWIYLGKK